jgi:excisionase family DNA binding protein
MPRDCQQAPIPHTVLLAKEVANILRVSKSTVYEMFETGRLKGFRVGAGNRGIRISRDSVEELMCEHHADAAPPASPANPRPKARPAPLPPPKIGGYGHGL